VEGCTVLSIDNDPFATTPAEQEMLDYIAANPAAILARLQDLQRQVIDLSCKLCELRTAESWRVNPDRMGR